MTTPSTYPSIPLNHLPLRPSTLLLFQRRGFVSTAELEDSRINGGMTTLAVELNVPIAQAASLIREVQSCLIILSGGSPNTSSPITTANDLLTARSQQNGNNANRCIVTFSKTIDQLLAGGIALGEVTEIAGMPGVGKTQLAMQLCVNARIPKNSGGVEGQAIYIDTEGSFTPERCFTMAQALVSHLRTSSQRRIREGRPCHPVPDNFVAEQILDGIQVYRVHDETAQTATIYSLEHVLKQHQHSQVPFRLVVIDSIAFHYRCAPPGQDYMKRTKSLTSIAAFLSELATKYNVAIVAINQMTTKWNADSGTRLVPALGESWAHATTTRLLLSKENESVERKCCLVKSPQLPAGTAVYQVLDIGIRGENQKTSSKASRTVTPNDENREPVVVGDASKRMRTQY
jgi:RAD51-like protein 2